METFFFKAYRYVNLIQFSLQKTDLLTSRQNIIEAVWSVRTAIVYLGQF